jgi:hypothetical protein
MIGSRVSGPQVTILIALAVLLAAMPATARAASSSGAPAAFSSAVTSGGPVSPPAKHPSHGCSVGSTLLNTLNPFSHCNPARQAANAITGVPGALAKAAATGIMDQVTGWMVQAAQTISGWVVKEAGVITRPDLNASWYLRLFSGLAALGGALAALVGLIALASAAIRRDPDALGEVIYGIARAGIGTSIVIALTIIALSAADAIANDFARQMPADFYKTLADQWGGSGWGGFGAAALAFLVAFVATIAGLLVWLELIVREAAIYIAVLFFPVGLAASIWPALRSWVRRLSMLLLMFVLLRPVVVIVLALAGSVTASGLSFGNGSVPHSVGTILAGVVIFALAAFTPWTLMFLLGTEIGVMHSRGSASSTGGRGSSGSSARDPVGGGLSTAPMLASGGEPAMAGAGAEGGGGSSGGGMRLSSLGGSGSGGATSSGGSIAAAAGWVGAAGSAAGRVGGQASQHAAARIHVAAGRSGVAPGGILPPSAGGLAGGAGSSQARTADPEPPSPPSFSEGSPSADGVGDPSGSPSGSPSSADSPSPVDSAVPPAAASATEALGAPPASPGPQENPSATEPPAPPSTSSSSDQSDEPPPRRPR